MAINLHRHPVRNKKSQTDTQHPPAVNIPLPKPKKLYIGVGARELKFDNLDTSHLVAFQNAYEYALNTNAPVFAWALSETRVYTFATNLVAYVCYINLGE